ncbi:hypothetical protein pb186bvf_013615 [Paramecium bursaria]
MKFINLSFENEELENRFQLQILKQSKKGFLLYQIIPIIVVIILLIDQILKENTIMIFWFIAQEFILGSYLILSFIYPIIFNYLSYYYYLVDFILGTLQFCYFEFKFLHLSADEIMVYQDILLQFFLIYRTRYNYIGGSLTLIFFISVRFYVQIGNGFQLSSIGYLLTGSFFIIEQSKQERFRRKLFIKSQKNKQLELLIEEFIDDQVSIIEKDQQNVRFKTLIFNKKYFDKADQLIQFLKNVRLPQKEQLINYLYKSTKQKETLLGSHQNNNYQVTYQSFILKKQQMFIKIKHLNKKLNKVINYKELYKHLIQGIQLRPQKLYKGKQIIKQLQMKSFYYQFTRYFQYYKVELDVVNYQYLKHIYAVNKIKLISSCQIKPFHSDQKLVFLIVYLIKQIHSNPYHTISMDDNMIRIEFQVSETISQYYIIQINKILYHIGYKQLDESITKPKINIILIDKHDLDKFY